MSKKQRFEEIINSFTQVHVLVIGDVMLDIYEWCDVKRVSPEAPILIANTKEETFFLGGAANVAHNARALDAKVTMIGVVGDDQMGEVLKNLLAEKVLIRALSLLRQRGPPLLNDGLFRDRNSSLELIEK